MDSEKPRRAINMKQLRHKLGGASRSKVKRLLNDTTIAWDIPAFRDSSSQLTLFSSVDADSLELTDAEGNSATFTLQDEVSAEFQCETFTVQQTFSGLPVRPRSFTGLAFDGTSLWFEDDNNDTIHPIDPVTGTLGDSVILPHPRLA